MNPRRLALKKKAQESFQEFFKANPPGPPAILPFQVEKEERLLKRVKICGRPTTYTNAKGKLVEYNIKCGVFRLCPYCLKKRAEFYRGRIESAWKETDGELVFTYMTEDDARRFTRSMDKAEYTKLPQPNGQVLIIGKLDNAKFADIKSDISIDDLDWSEIAKTPQRKRPSGNLGRQVSLPPSKDDSAQPEKSVECEVLHVTLDFDNIEDVTAAKKVAEEEMLVITGELNPKFDGDELTQARNRRTKIYVNELECQGAKILYQAWKNETVHFSAYSAWDQYILTPMQRAIHYIKKAGKKFTERTCMLRCIAFGGNPLDPSELAIARAALAA